MFVVLNDIEKFEMNIEGTVLKLFPSSIHIHETEHTSFVCINIICSTEEYDLFCKPQNASIAFWSKSFSTEMIKYTGWITVLRYNNRQMTRLYLVNNFMDEMEITNDGSYEIRSGTCE